MRENPFRFIKPTEGQLIETNDLRLDFEILTEKITKKIKDSPELGIVIQKLEEASMWANKAITHTEARK